MRHTTRAPAKTRTRHTATAAATTSPRVLAVPASVTSHRARVPRGSVRASNGEKGVACARICGRLGGNVGLGVVHTTGYAHWNTR